MELKEWRLLAVGSISILLVVLLSCIPFPKKAKSSTDDVVHAGQEVIEPAKEEAEAVFSEKEIKTAKETVWTTIEQEEDKYIKIPKQEGIEGAGIYLQDDYMSSQIILNMEGNPEIKYDASVITRAFGDKIYKGSLKKEELLSKIEVKRTSIKGGKRLRILFTVKKILEPVLYETDEAFYITLTEPAKMYDHILVLDAGHGGIDEGTMSVDKKYYEKNYTLALLKSLRTMFEGRNIKVYCTRTEDITLSKQARVDLANKLHADLFISIHCNAANAWERHIGGLETLYSLRTPEYGTLKNKKLAEIMLEELHQTTSLEKRGTIQREGLYLLHHSRVPATIVEVGYMTNTSDMKFMKTKNGQELILKGLYRGILKALQQNK